MTASTGPDLGGLAAVVTGSSRGLGRAFAEALAAVGASVVVNGRDPAATRPAPTLSGDPACW
jgi:NAD(P)-dependent dehydrogenase (short-subunit alcohol dehydrogenase family)